MPYCYALHTDGAGYGFPARYSIRRYKDAATRRAALEWHARGVEAARVIRAEGGIIPACVPTEGETLEALSPWAVSKVTRAAFAAFGTFDREYRYTGDLYADAALYLN